MKEFLTAQWRHLLMLNYEVPPGSLAPFVPVGTELDAWRGSTFVSLVAFRFTHTRVFGVAVPFHRDFDEVNLRFYVRRESRGEVRRGVVFLRELVPRRAIAAVARTFYNEPYLAVPMRSTITHDPAPHVSYGWSLGDHWHTCSARGAGLEGSLSAPDTLATFITEHYWGYTRQRNGRTVEYHVVHPRWTVWPATDVQVRADLSLLSGTLAPLLSAPPRSAFIADGSAVTVFRPQLLPESGNLRTIQ